MEEFRDFSRDLPWPFGTSRRAWESQPACQFNAFLGLVRLARSEEHEGYAYFVRAAWVSLLPSWMWGDLEDCQR